MEIVVVDYRLCCFSYGFHKHRGFSSVFRSIAQALIASHIKPNKLIFAVDVGKSKRCDIFPEYKASRKELQKKESPAEQKRRKKFNIDYYKSIEFLKNFVTVIDIAGIEADDIGSIIANRFANTEHTVTLFSSDKDWASFLIAKNIRMLRLIDNDFITVDSCEEKYELDPQGIFFLQVFAGSRKENVPGLNNFGNKTFIKAYEKSKDYEDLKIYIKEKYLDTGFRKISLPENISYEDMLERNFNLFKPVTIQDLSEKEKSEFLKKFTATSGGNYDEISYKALLEYDINFWLSEEEQKFYKLS